MNLLAALVIVVGSIVVLVFLVVAELDRNASPHRFSIRVRRSHVAPASHGRWRWYIHPRFQPDAIDVIVGAGRPALAGWSHTLLGALVAAHRSRRRIEADLVRDRREFLALLAEPEAGIAEDDSHRVFPAETREQA